MCDISFCRNNLPYNKVKNGHKKLGITLNKDRIKRKRTRCFQYITKLYTVKGRSYSTDRLVIPVFSEVPSSTKEVMRWYETRIPLLGVRTTDGPASSV